MNKTNVFGAVQNSASSSSSISNFTKRFAVLTLLLLTVVLGTRAASYTISNGNNYLGINIANNGNATIANINPFNASTCVWTGPDSGSDRFYMTVNGTTYYLRRENNGSLTVTTNQNNATSWTINGESLYCRPSNSSYYINYNNGWSTQRSSGNGTLAKVTYKDPTGITAEGVEILVGEEGQITYNLTSTSGTPVYDNVTFSINNTGIATINATTGVVTGVSAGTATVTVTAKKQDGTTACTATCSVVVKEPIPTQYVFYYSSNYGAYYLAVNDARNGVTSTQNFNAETCIWTGVDVGAGLYSATVDGMTYYLRLQSSGYNNYTLTITTEKNEATQWTINDAKLYSNGRYVRYNSGWITTGTPTNSGTDVLYPITKISEGTPTTTVEYTVGNTTVSPTAAAVDYGKTQQFTANASVTKTTTTTKTDTYQHSSSTGNTIQPKPSVSSTSSETLSPTGYDWSLSSTENLAVGAGTASTSSVTYSTASGTTKNVTLNVTAYYMDGASKKQGAAGTATITVNEKKDDPIGISAQPLTLAVDEQKSISYTLTPSNAYDNIAYSGNYNGIISIDANGVVTGLKAGITEVTLTAKNQNGTNSEHSATSTVTVTPKAPTIEFALGANNTATISTTETGATIYYTTDGTTPTISSSVYTAPVSVTAGATVKAIVVVMANSTQLTSPVAEALAMAESGVIGGTVFLYDLEDHTWTYYSGVDRTVDGGNYNDNYAGKLYSPNPRNVKITYNANGGAVSIDESETSFVYFKTLEQGATAGQYPYTVISNPFSKRPTGKGFGGWKIISGGEYINGYNNGSTLPLDQEITFVNLPYPSTNCISAEIVLEATWVNLNNIVRRTSTDAYTYSATGGTYETNILVLKSNHAGTITVNSPCTIMMVEPDGSDDFRDNYTFSGYIVPMANGNTKIEFAHWNPGNEGINPRGRNFTIGRGMVMDGTRRALYGTNTSSSAVNQILKVESGNFSTFTHYAANPSDITKQWIYLGNDYDRANGKDDKLTFSGLFMVGDGRNLGLSSTEEMCRVFSISGSFMTSISISTGAADYSYYLGVKSNHNNGHRYFEVQGGEWYANIAGGMGEDQDKASRAFTFRMKGGIIRGSIYGAGAFAPAGGERRYIITGGNIGGWVAAGCNGIGGSTTQDNNGATNGDSYVYVGGNAKIGYQNRTINDVEGGNVFGAGRGAPVTNYNVGTINNSNVVVADKAEVEKNVYGGGNYGFSLSEANIYITGGSVDGRVFGGANMTKGYSPTIIMTGGHVIGGIYGGCNTEGTINNNVTMQINGGQVGTSSAPANIHGGGYGQATRVSGNVEVTLGTANQATGGVTVYGDVYGGSALGAVNSDANDHTYVTMYKGTINGSLYGGGLGSASVAANVNGPVKVEVRGGSVKATSVAGSGGVYGANNINGAPQRSVTVDIYGTDPAPAEGEYALYAVYGGGNQADYLYGNGYPTVTVHGCDNSIEYVYGGGNAAAVAATDVTIWGGNVIGNVFGGGNGESGTAANVNGQTNVYIHGGTILNVYGGSNSKGTIGDAINVKVESKNEPGEDLCTMNIGSIYGGGNMAASDVGNIDIVCTGDNGRIDNVYGGANQANITGNIDLKINGGNIGNVFGGNNIKGDISGNITVTVGNNPNDCGVFQIDNVYGAGNLAPYGSESVTKGNYPVVNIYSGTIKKNVYGGGLGESAIVYGNPQVTIGDAVEGHIAIVDGDVYGGGDAADVKGTPVVRVVNDCNTQIGNVYGGGNAADVSATNVTINGGVITGMVFGGGHGDKNADPQTEANVNGDVNVLVTGGTINKVFGGSNSKGNIGGVINLIIEKGDESCELHITEVYGGGNEAAGNAGTITIGCTGSEEEGIGDVYGGANAADIKSDITLNITGGKINRVFGGNNASGSISGGIVVNVNWNTENPCGVNYLGNVYGAGNLAQYGSASSNKGNYPAVNILNGTVSGHVFGGGLGESAIVYGNPQVTIGDNNASHTAIVTGDVYGGGDAANVVGTPVVKVVNDCNTQIGNVYGGGNAADVSATSVTIDGGKITGMVFGGGHGDKDAEPQTEANVNGDVNVLVTGGTINKVFGGSNSKGNIGGVINLIIEKGDESCELHITEVYGGGNEAAGNAGTINIACTGGEEEGIGDVYGGANAADINSDITLNITGGKINRVFGGNNTSGGINGNIQVNVDWTGICGINALGNVYGAGNQAAYGNAENQGSTQVNILNATVSGSVYGGGLGNSAVVTGTTEVNISEKDGGTVVVNENVFGGGDAAAVTGSTDVNIIAGAVAGSVFGGGNAAGVSGVGVVNVTGGTIASGVYGGSNASGIVGNTQVTLTNGIIGTDAAHANVHGGGFGQETGVSGNVDILIGESNQTEGGVEIYGDVYGGSALGTVNGTSANDTYHTNVTLNKGTIYGSLYGGALGSNEVEANVYAPVTVTVNGGSVKATSVDGSGGVYGANNINGSPQRSVTVDVYGTDPAPSAGQYALYAVYGGGNRAPYIVSGYSSAVTVHGCDNSIEYVYGGGNAAAVSATNVTIWGGNIGDVFGGGHGYKENSIGADVNGDVLVNIHGGTIDKVFGGSNSMGNITGNISLNITKEGECEMHIAEVYGGGNEAAGNAGTITIGCTGGEGEGIGDVYGGANAADINSAITLNITGGNISRVFGGNNASGSINGDIQVNVDWSGTCGVNALGNVYGAGNLAPYSGKTAVNILNGTVTGSVFGGGLGDKAIVTGTTLVNINQESGGTVVVSQNVFGGGDAAEVTGSTDVNIIAGAVAGSVFGGGNAAGVSGVGVVDVTGGTIASGVYGGSNASGIVGNTQVTLANGIIGTDAAHANVHGGGYGEDTQVSGNVAVNIQGGTIYGDVYGGSALGTVNTNTNNTTKVNLIGGIIHGDAYGGGLGNSSTAADVYGNVTVTLNGTAFVLITTKDDQNNTIPTSGRVFGCNNINGTPKGTVLVKVLQTVARDSEGNIIQKPEKGSGIYELEAVYGGGNLAAYNPDDSKADGPEYSYTYGNLDKTITAAEKPVQVIIDACDDASISYVYGGGNAAPTPATQVVVLGSYEIGNVFGGGNGKDRYTLDGINWQANNGADVGIINATAYANNPANGLYGTGRSRASVLGGTVHNLFGGSNTKGNIVTEAVAHMDEASDCKLSVGGIYGGGNEAYMDGDSKIELGCIESLKEIYGGSCNADIKGDVNLKIVSGHYDRVFGGNNLGGVIKGSITITVEETGCNPVTIGELYACGNLAPYTTPENKDHPTINLISFTSIGNVFGGGLGSKAVVTGNPVVNINVNKVGVNAERDWSYNGSTINFGNDYIVQLPVHEKGKIGVIGTVYGGGNEAEVVGNPQIEMTAGEVKRDIFGGGNKADVDGSTSVTIAYGTIDGNIFGGGNAAAVEGSTSVTILDGTIGGNVYGGGNEGNVTGATHVVIGPQLAQ